MKKLFLIGIFSTLLISLNSCKKDASKAAASENNTEESSAEKKSDKNAVSFYVNTENSIINWTGSKPGKDHTGTIKIKKGLIKLSEGNVVFGRFNMDMNSLEVTDLEGDMKASLEGHLKGTEEGKEDDFFFVSNYPTATFNMTKITVLENDPEGSHLIYGDLTLKGITRNIGFKAMITISDSGVTVKTPDFTIDRTDFDIKFMSKSVFDNLKDKFIEDDIKLSIDIVADMNPATMK